MDERVVQFRIGVMVLATLIIAVILMLMFGQGPQIFQSTYTIYLDFPEAPGVTIKSPIRKSGILIGRVTEVKLLDEGGVRITAEIDSDKKIFTDEVCRISHSLLNDAVLEFTRNHSNRKDSGQPAPLPPPAAVPVPPRQSSAAYGEASPIAEVPIVSPRIPVILTAMEISVDLGPNAPKYTPIALAAQASPAPAAAKAPVRIQIRPGAEIKGEVSPDALQVVADLQGNLTRAIDSVTNTSDQMGAFIGKIDRVLGPEKDLIEQRAKLQAMIERTMNTLDSISNVANTANDVIGNPKIKETIDKFPDVVDDTRKTLGQMNNAIDLVDRNLQNLDTFTQALGEKGPNTLARIDQAADKLDRLMCQLSAFGESLNGDKGSLGQLLHNPDLYQNLNQAVVNIKDLTEQLQPIVRDARVFTDKIARHPETLGVRGALNPSSGAKGAPTLFPHQTTEPQLRFDP